MGAVTSWITVTTIRSAMNVQMISQNGHTLVDFFASRPTMRPGTITNATNWLTACVLVVKLGKV